MHILVTGSKGLIGDALSKKLREVGIQVTGMDTRNPSDHPEFGNILDKNLLTERIENCDGIVHLAAISRVADAEKNPKVCWETNVMGTQNVVDAAIQSSKKPWIIFSSSREVYGQPASLPVNESAPLKPINTYGMSKLEGERILHEAAHQGIRCAIVRITNVFGSINDYNERVIPTFCRAVLKNLPVRVDGKDRLFDFLHLDDAVSGLMSLINKMSTSSLSIDPINLVTSKPYSLWEIAELIKKLSGSSSEITEGKKQGFDVTQFSGSFARAQSFLGWSPKVEMTKGLTMLIDKYKELS